MTAPLPHVLLLDCLSLRLLRRIRRREGPARVVLWTPGAAGAAMLRLTAQTAERVLVQDALADEAAPHLPGGWAPLSREFPALAAQLRRLAATGSAKASEPDETGPIVFCPSNDTHCRMFQPIAARLPQSRFLHFHAGRGENTERTLAALGLAYETGGPAIVERWRPSVLVFGNDWNVDSVRMIEAAWRRRVPTVCLQEGCLDLGTPLGRMELCDFPLVLGPIMPRYLPHHGYFVTGNPRFDALRPEPPPPRPRVMINCNFTYGVHEDARDAWVGAVTRTCKDLGVEYFISQHPRDTGRFPGEPVRPSGPGEVQGHLREASVLVSRFSTLIYEALLMGRPAVYFNPHGETMRLFNEDDTGGIARAVNAGELRAALEAALRPVDAARRACEEKLLDLHCGPRDGGAAERCATAIERIARLASPHDYAPWRRSVDRVGEALRRRWGRLAGGDDPSNS